MKCIHVDLDRCEGHGRCYAIAPDLLEPFDDHGHSQFIGSPIDPSDAELFNRADRAVQSCPEEALSWKDASEA
jgi:ferredoxin